MCGKSLKPSADRKWSGVQVMKYGILVGTSLELLDWNPEPMLCLPTTCQVILLIGVQGGIYPVISRTVIVSTNKSLAPAELQICAPLWVT